MPLGYEMLTIQHIISGEVEIGSAGAGVILRSPDGTRYRMTMANGGTLSIAPA